MVDRDRERFTPYHGQPSFQTPDATAFPDVRRLFVLPLLDGPELDVTGWIFPR